MDKSLLGNALSNNVSTHSALRKFKQLTRQSHNGDILCNNNNNNK